MRQPTLRKSGAQKDKLKLLILVGFVLFVFWAGVAVVIGFSHGHDSHPFPPGILIPTHIRNSGNKLNEEPERIEEEEEKKPGQTCCESPSKIECIACHAGVTVAQYCMHNQGSAITQTGCGHIYPDVKGKFTGAYYFSAPNAVLDHNAITLSAWIYLEKDDIVQMKTILSNRFSGCVSDSSHQGYALYVNDWNTNDMSLNLMWSTPENPCIRLSTPPQSLEFNKWYHVAATLDSSNGGTVGKLFINGVEKATFSSALRLIAAVETPNVRFVVGAHSGSDKHPFIGKIGHVSVSHGISNRMATSLDKVAFDPSFTIYSFWKEFVGDAIQDNSPTKVTLVRKSMFSDQLASSDDDSFEFLVELGPTSELVTGDWPRNTFFLNKELKEKSDDLARKRRELVKNAMKHAYGSYEKYAFGADEVTPRSGVPRNNWGGMAVTMVDALDTLWIMGLKEEFWRARDYCRDKLRFDRVGSVSVFETTIRVLGGLMSAYDLSQDKAFLDRGLELGERLSKAFDTSSGLPVPSVVLSTGSKGGGGQVVIAEVGTLQLEFRSLAYNAREPKYASLVENVHKQMRKSPPENGLWPIYVNTHTGQSSGGVVTFGALGDSFFEYLLKIWVQGGLEEPEYLADYERAMDGVHRLIVQKSSPTGLTYLGDLNPGNSINHKMDHLACFVPGMLALGVRKRGESVENQVKNKRDMTVAKALAYTCVQMYERQATGISPEYVNFQSGSDFTVPYNAPFYILRPETVESLYILHTMTGHPVYRDWGYRIMLKIEKHCRVEHGYGALPDVRSISRIPDDRMESFFLAETLKYLYLLQDPDSEINLDEWVFNTEAHPLKIFPKGWRKKLGLD